MSVSETKKVKDYLDQKFLMIVGSGFNLNIQVDKIDKVFRNNFNDVLDLEVKTANHHRTGVVLYV